MKIEIKIEYIIKESQRATHVFHNFYFENIGRTIAFNNMFADNKMIFCNKRMKKYED